MVSVTFRASGSVTATSCAVSSTGKYQVNGSRLTPAPSRTWTSNTPNARRAVLAVRPSISRTCMPCGRPASRNQPKLPVRARCRPTLTVTPGSGAPVVVRMRPTSDAGGSGRPCGSRTTAAARCAARPPGPGHRRTRPRTRRDMHRRLQGRHRGAGDSGPGAAGRDGAGRSGPAAAEINWAEMEPVNGPLWFRSSVPR